MSVQRAQYTASVAGQQVTLTPISTIESQPGHLAASTIVVTTVGNPAPADMWKTGELYTVLFQHMT